MPKSQSYQVFRLVSDFVGIRFGQISDFEALVADPRAPSQRTIGATSRPFARVAMKVLRRLGGEYAALADWLETNAVQPDKEVPGSQAASPELTAIDEIKLPVANQEGTWAAID